MLVVGILNRTRDSFYDGDRFFTLDSLLCQAEWLVANGADVVEIGCRPGGVGVRDVTVAEELDLVCETVATLRRRIAVPLAVDTTRAAVATAAFEAGVVLGNDTSGFQDPAYLPAAARAGASVVATHIRLPPGVPDSNPRYGDVVADVGAALRHLVEVTRAASLGPERVIVDPGLDLGKTWQQSLRLLAATETFAAIGPPLLIAASNKIFLSRLLGLEKAERDVATAAACTAGVLRGARVLRVHDARIGRHAGDLAVALLTAG